MEVKRRLEESSNQINIVEKDKIVVVQNSAELGKISNVVLQEGDWQEVKGRSAGKGQQVTSIGNKSVNVMNGFNPLDETGGHKTNTLANIEKDMGQCSFRGVGSALINHYEAGSLECKGFNKVYKHKEIKMFLRDNKVGMTAVTEHRVQEKYAVV